MSRQELNFTIRGVSPLLMHNGQLANPLNEWARQMKTVSGKRPKTDADYEELSRLEWYGSLYLKDGLPCIPGEVLEAALVEGARKKRLGKLFTAGVLCPDSYALHFDGDGLSLDEMWEGGEHCLVTGVRIQRARIMRTRPQFKNWWADIPISFEDGTLNESQVRDILPLTGEVIGLLDWRPRFGRFTVDE